MVDGRSGVLQILLQLLLVADTLRDAGAGGSQESHGSARQSGPVAHADIGAQLGFCWAMSDWHVTKPPFEVWRIPRVPGTGAARRWS